LRNGVRMAQNKIGVYLAIKGQVFGPYSESDFQQLHRTGEIERFRWIWDLETSQWRALDPAPAPLRVGATETVKQAPQTAPQATLAAQAFQAQPTAAAILAHVESSKFVEAKNIAAICHNYHHAVAGRIGDVTANGCELVSDEPYSSPPLCTRSLVHLNLLDEESGKSVNVEARIFDIMKTQRGWMYRIHWDQAPAIL